MCAELFELPGHRDVIFQRIFWPAFVEDVAGIANSCFADGAGFKRGIDRNAHVLNGVGRIKNPKDVDALIVSFAYEFDNDVVGIGGVSNSIGAAEKHLEANIGNAASKFAQALPGIFVEKAQRSVERRSTPHLEAEKIRQLLRDDAGSGQQIVSPNARR